nr:uncharacterized protein LOC127347822 [Lolium perenne]
MATDQHLNLWLARQPKDPREGAPPPSPGEPQPPRLVPPPDLEGRQRGTPAARSSASSHPGCRNRQIRWRRVAGHGKWAEAPAPDPISRRPGCRGRRPRNPGSSRSLPCPEHAADPSAATRLRPPPPAELAADGRAAASPAVNMDARSANRRAGSSLRQPAARRGPRRRRLPHGQGPAATTGGGGAGGGRGRGARVFSRGEGLVNRDRLESADGYFSIA